MYVGEGRMTAMCGVRPWYASGTRSGSAALAGMTCTLSTPTDAGALTIGGVSGAGAGIGAAELEAAGAVGAGAVGAGAVGAVGAGAVGAVGAGVAAVTNAGLICSRRFGGEPRVISAVSGLVFAV